MRRLWAIIGAVLLISLGCSISSVLTTQIQSDGAIRQSTTTFTASPTSSPVPPTSTLDWSSFISKPTSTRMDTGWQVVQNRLDRRTIQINNQAGSRVEILHIFRVDPAFFALNVAYDPVSPKSLVEWHTETGALLVVNGSYFSITNDTYVANGLIILDGRPFGSSYGHFAGMLAIHAGGSELRWLAQKPYNPNEPLVAGLQSFPMLVKPGGKLGFPAQYEDYIAARRTVVGQDSFGRILFLVAPIGHFTLHQLSRKLLELDLDLQIAMNLDGGPSSGFFLADPLESIPAYSELPLVITVSPDGGLSVIATSKPF